MLDAQTRLKYKIQQKIVSALGVYFVEERSESGLLLNSEIRYKDTEIKRQVRDYDLPRLTPEKKDIAIEILLKYALEEIKSLRQRVSNLETAKGEE